MRIYPSAAAAGGGRCGPSASRPRARDSASRRSQWVQPRIVRRSLTRCPASPSARDAVRAESRLLHRCGTHTRRTRNFAALRCREKVSADHSSPIRQELHQPSLKRRGPERISTALPAAYIIDIYSQTNLFTRQVKKKKTRQGGLRFLERKTRIKRYCLIVGGLQKEKKILLGIYI